MLPLFRSTLTKRTLKPVTTLRLFSTTLFKPATMAQEYKLKDITSLSSILEKDGSKQEAEVEGIEKGKVLLIRSGGKIHATGAKCTHYGAPLVKGVVSSDGRLTCPWHGACFKIESGDVEDAPALDPIAKFEIVEKDGAVYIKGEEQEIKSGMSLLNISCKPQGQEKVLVIGGGSGTNGIIEELRKCAFKGHIQVLSRETTQTFDRTKLSKALISDLSKIAWRTPEFYQKAGIEFIKDEATSVDFESKSVSTASGKSYDYTKLVIAVGGHPKSLPLPGLKEGELENVFLLRSLVHTQGINDALGDSSKKVVVIGSSFIGMEVANHIAGREAKHQVTVVGMDKIPTEAIFGEKLGSAFQKILEKNGVNFKMGAEVEKATPKDGKKVGALHLKDGTVLEADLIIEGVGVGPATEFLKESKGAPELEKDGSIKVDEHFQVPSLPGVYAIGDVATYPYHGQHVRIEHWNVAQNAGRQVARDITGKPVKSFTPVFWSALGAQLRYCGNTSMGYDDVIIDGSLEVSKEKMPSFAAYYCKGEEVVAVATMAKDPVMSQVAELMRRGTMLKKSQIKTSDDVLSASL